MADAPAKSDTETEILRRSMTPRNLYWNRWFIGVGIPTLIAFRACLKVAFVKRGWSLDWIDSFLDPIMAYSAAMGGFMDGIWKRRHDERNNTK